MGMTTGLVALALWGADPAPAANSKNMVTCQMQVMTIEGLGWRDAAYAQLKPAARQGSATVWTADRELKAKLEQSCLGGRSVKAPRVSSDPDAVATIKSDQTQDYISHVERISDGPVNAGTMLAFRPEIGTIREGFDAVVMGRRLDQGVLARVKVTESHVGTLHTIQLHERVEPAGTATACADSAAGTLCARVQAALTAGPETLATTVQIPEVYLSQVEGEWLVPNDGILLISMGVNTVANAQGKAVVHERLAILDFARPCDEANVSTAYQAQRAKDDAIAQASYSALAMPTVPDRSIPEAIDADGKIHELPPLPEAYAAADLNQIAPGTPAATPQSVGIVARPVSDEPNALPVGYASADLNRITPSSPANMAVALGADRTMVDPQLARTSLEVVPDHEVDADAAMLASYQAQMKEMLAADAEAVRCAATTCPIEPHANLASVVESFLRSGMDSAIPVRSCMSPDLVTEADLGCPAAGCPFATEGCPTANSTRMVIAPAQVTVDVNFADPKGHQASSGPLDINRALVNPGQPEVKYIPLGDKLSLEIQAKVVARPAAPVQR